MQVLVIGRSLPEKSTGMIGIFEFEQAELLQSHGIDVTYFFNDHRSIKKHMKFKRVIKGEKKEVPYYGSYIPVGGLTRQLFDLIKYKRFKKLFEDYKKNKGLPQLVHIHFPLITVNRKIVDYLLREGVSIVVTEHWSKVLRNKLSSNELQFMNYIYHKSDRYIAVSEKLRISIENLLFSKKASIHVIPNFIHSNYKYKKTKRENDVHNFYTMGRLVESKRNKFILNAFQVFLLNSKNAKLHIIGDGPEKQSLVKEAEKLAIVEHVKFYGFVDHSDLPDLISEFQTNISAGKIETFGVPAIESMALGNTVLAVKGGPLDKTILANQGLVFEASSKDDLTQKMEIIYCKYFRNEIDEENISKTVTEEFSANTIYYQLRNIYDEILLKES